MIFKKQSLKTYTNIELGLNLKHVQHYSIIDGDTIGHFYCTQGQSVGQLQDTHVLIENVNNKITNSLYHLKNLNNNAIVGKILISNFVLGKSLSTTVDIIHQDIYKWQVLKTDRGFSLFTSKVWSKFYGKLFNATEDATFEWDYSSREIYKYRLESLPVTGKINLSNRKNHFLFFAGMFLMEMELQMKAVD